MVLCSMNMEGKVRLPNSCPVYIYILRVQLYVDKHYHGAKLVRHDIWCTHSLAYYFIFRSKIFTVYSQYIILSKYVKKSIFEARS